MRHDNLIPFILLLLIFSCDTANNVDPVFESYFVKYYGEDGIQVGIDMLVNPDGTMVLLGNSSSLTNRASKPFIVKIDPLGNVLWQRQMGHDTNTEMAVDIERDNQGNLIVVSNLGEEAVSRIWLYRLTQEGIGIDSAEFPSNRQEFAKSVSVTSDDRFLITGYAAPIPGRNPNLNPALDIADVIVVEFDEVLNPRYFSLVGGGEYEGAGVKIFEETLGGGNQKFFLFGYSDTPFGSATNTFKLRLEVTDLDFFGAPGNLRMVSGIETERQVAATAIRTPESHQAGYLLVGTSYAANNLSSNIYITQYTNEFIKRIDKPILLGRRLEGVSAATADPDVFFILGNETRENNRRDIFLVKLASDGTLLGTKSFGTFVGDDIAGAVKVLPDNRVAILGTLELETQKKMVLIIVNSEGKFSN